MSPEQITTLRHCSYASTSYSDAQMGRLLAALRDTGRERDTVVAVWSDHGFHLGKHGLWAKTTNYEVDTRVPLIIAAPGRARAGLSSAALVELLDLYPTLADLCGLPAPAGVEGRSLRPWLEEPPAAFSQFPRPWFYSAHPEFMGYAVRTPTHRYVEWRRFGTLQVEARELYAYDGDELFETENPAGRPEKAARVRQLAALLPGR